jgi:hypothetical protein
MSKTCPASRDTYEEADAHETANALRDGSSLRRARHTLTAVRICRKQHSLEVRRFNGSEFEF